MAQKTLKIIVPNQVTLQNQFYTWIFQAVYIVAGA